MPRRRPDEVVVHRIELGPWERSHIGPLTTSLTAKPWLNSFTDIIRDNSALLFVAGVLTLLLPQLPPGWREDLGIGSEDQGTIATIKDWLELQNLVGGVAGFWGGAWAGAPGGPWASLAMAVAGFFSGLVAVEVGEEISEELQEAAAEARRLEAEAQYAAAQTTTTAILISVIGLLERIANRDS
tara:strand:+ start:703 stop:1254 length:552 start_codon:yes stop_codon:yes gene_type:complete